MKISASASSLTAVVLPWPFCSFPSTMCLHMVCFNKQKIEALKLKFPITFKCQQYIPVPLESYENFCFSIFTYSRGKPRSFRSFPSTMCWHMVCFNERKIEALKLKFSITFQCRQYIPVPLESYENFCFSIFTYSRGKPRSFRSFPSTMCWHMVCFNERKIEALKLKFSITFQCRQYRWETTERRIFNPLSFLEQEEGKITG